MSAMTASGVNHKTYCGEYTLLTAMTMIITKIAV